MGCSMLSIFNRMIGKIDKKEDICSTVCSTKKISSVGVTITIDAEDVVSFTASVTIVDANFPILKDLTGVTKLELAFLANIETWIKSQLGSTQKEPVYLTFQMVSLRDNYDRLIFISIDQVCKTINETVSGWVSDQITNLPLFHVKKCIGDIGDVWHKSINPIAGVNEAQRVLKDFLTSDIFNKFQQKAEKVGIVYIENEEERSKFPAKVCIVNRFDENNMPLYLLYSFGRTCVKANVRCDFNQEELLKRMKENNFEASDLVNMYSELDLEMKVFSSNVDKCSQKAMCNMIREFNKKWLGKAVATYIFNEEKKQRFVHIKDIFNKRTWTHEIRRWNTGDILSGRFFRDIQEEQSYDNESMDPPVRRLCS